MDLSPHTMSDLFAQLGLANMPKDIEAFVAAHRPLKGGVRLSEAAFWSADQARFLREEILEDADWAEVVDQQSFEAGSVVCREGAPAEHWVGVVEGMVKVDTVSEDGRATSFIGVSTGGWLGEGSLLKRESRPYEIVALKDSWIALMPFSTFDWLYRTSLDFNHFLVEHLNARLGQFVALVESVRTQSPAAQVAFCLSELFNPALSPMAPRRLAISQDEVAKLCGLSRSIVNRTLQRLQGAGQIHIQYGGIEVLNVSGLHDFAQGGMIQ